MANDGFEAFGDAGDIVIADGPISSGNSVADSGGFIDPKSADEADYQRDEQGNIKYSERTGKPLRKRGRRGAGGNGSAVRSSKKSAGNVQAIETLSQTLLIVHMGIAAIVKYDGFALEKSEADALGVSLANVMEQFDITPDPRFTAVAGLVTTASMIYGPRAYLYREHVKAIKKKQREEQKQAQEPQPFFTPNMVGQV